MSNLSKESLRILQRKHFSALRNFIDACLQGTPVSEEECALVTTDKDTLLEYAHVLESKLGRGRVHRRILANVISDINAVDRRMSGLVAKRLNWKLLPTGPQSFRQIVRHFDDLSKRVTHVVYDIGRLHKVYSLGPDEVYIGTDEFDGYVVFCFRESTIAVLECPVTGNAIYVFGENWKSLSRLSKADLLNSDRHDVERIIHNGEWFARLRSSIPLRATSPPIT